MGNRARLVAGLLVLAASIGCGGPATPTSVAPGPLGLTAQEFDERLEALVLGMGPLSPRGNAGCSPGQLSGLSAQTTHFTLVFSRRITEAQRDAVTRVFGGYRDVAGMGFSFEASIVDEVSEAKVGEFTFDVVSDPALFCGAGAVGCAGGGSPISRALGRVILGNTSTQLAGHEAGHLIGLCHVEATTGTTGQTAMLGAGGLGPLDVAALKKVYGAGLRPGATKADFVRAGVLPRPQ